MSEAKRTINGVHIPDDVVGFAPPHVAVMAEVCASQGIPFLFVGGIAEFIQTDQEVEADRNAMIINRIDTMSTPLRPEDRIKLIQMDTEGYDDAFAVLYKACKERNWPFIRELFTRRVVQPHVITSGWDPIHVLARWGGGDVLRWLAKAEGYKVDFNKISFTGKTPLHYAVGGMEPSSTIALLEMKVDATIRDNMGLLAVDCLLPKDGAYDLRVFEPDALQRLRDTCLAVHDLLPFAHARVRDLAGQCKVEEAPGGL